MSWVTSTTTAISGGPADLRSSFDASGWNVATGGSKATGGARSQSEGGAPLLAGLSTETVVVIACAAVVLLLLMKRKR